uniref:NAD(P)H-hydrate epimerase n=1 Tax=Dracunculus medinensis TaxID=318479 RepID=A0A0N4U8N4_DRAME
LLRMSSRKSPERSKGQVKYLSQNEAIAIDQELFTEYGFSVDQLMELAGLSCANAVVRLANKCDDILVISGPGNNGGDGLVCARHLKLFGYKPTVLYPKQSKSDLMSRLITQITKMEIPFIKEESIQNPSDIEKNFSFIVDAIFGFSFIPPLRPPFDRLIDIVARCKTRVLSIDIPSGWHVEDGPSAFSVAIKPYALISLTAPKMCAKHFDGTHFLGGRFVPNSLIDRYSLNLPEYPDFESIMVLSK